MLDGEDDFTPTPSPPPLPPEPNGVPQYAIDTGMLLTARPLRPFKSSEEYLWAMKEDLAEWLNNLYGLDIGPEDFMERLETGETLCRHANQVRRLALERQRSGRNGFPAPVPAKEVVFRAGVAAGTFLARDNVSNFISWCRALGIYECLLFETDDLVLRKNERSFILCLLEVGRRGAKFGMPAPLLVQLEQEIDREIAKDNAKKKGGSNEDDEEYDFDYEEDLEPPPQIITNDLKNLDEMVRFLVNRCTCPVQFPMHRVSDGKYRIGDTQMLIFVRILRSHVMVRVGGGWDTLEHYLDKHDPCRCKQGHRVTVGSKVVIQRPNSASPALPHMQVTYERSPDSFMRSNTPSSGGIRGTPGSPQRVRRASLTSKSSTGSLASTGSERINNHEGEQLVSGDQLARRLSLGARQPNSTNEVDSSPRQRPPPAKGSRIPCPDESLWPPLSRRRRSQSSDHLTDDTADLAPRRLSGGEAWAGRRRDGPMTRSRSQCSEDSEMAAFVGRRGSPGRHSCRGQRSSPSPSRLPRACTPAQSQTWSCRTRESRPALAPDLFKPPPNSSPNSRRALAPLVHEVLAAAASDEQLLRRMEQIVQQYRGRLDPSPAAARAPEPPEFPRATYTRQWVARHGSPSLASPEESSSAGEGEGIERTPVRVSPRRDPVPGSTRIPVPTFYSSA